MTTDTANLAPASLAEHEAAAALHAITDQAKADNLAVVASLSDDADDRDVAEHIRAVVAMTIGHLSTAASDITRNHAEHWQAWALGVADGPSKPLG